MNGAKEKRRRKHKKETEENWWEQCEVRRRLDIGTENGVVEGELKNL